jgi:hypothetical protein
MSCCNETSTIEMKDPPFKLGRLVQFDNRSLGYPIRPLLPELAPRSYSWRCDERLDQGNIGSCVGMGFSYDLAARPVEVPGVTEATALQIYHLAQTLDPWSGEAYEGTSVLAGAKATKQLFPRAFDSYRWAFGLNDVILTLGYRSPVILGIPWLSNMFNPDSNGIIKATGSQAGGHCILADAVDVTTRYVRMLNSWGRGWGKNGRCWISFDDLDKLLHMEGEALVTVRKHMIEV